MGDQTPNSSCLPNIVSNEFTLTDGFIRETSRMPIEAFNNSMKAIIKRNNADNRRLVDNLRKQLISKFIDKFEDRLEPYGQGLKEATLVHRNDVKDLLEDVHRICFSIENESPSEEVKLLLQIAPFNDMVASCQAAYSSQVDDRSAVMKIQVEALTRTVIFLQGQLSNFQQIVIELKDEIKNLKENNNNSSDKHKNSSFKYISLNNSNLNETTQKGKKRRADLCNEQEEHEGESDAEVLTCSLVAPSSESNLPSFSEVTKQVNKQINKSNVNLGSPAVGNREIWRVREGKRGSIISKTPNPPNALHPNTRNNTNKTPSGHKIQRPNYKYHNKNLIVGNRTNMSLKSVPNGSIRENGIWQLGLSMSKSI